VNPYNLSSGDAAAHLAVSAETVNRWADAGELHCIRTPGGIRRFRQSDIDDFVAGMENRQAKVVRDGAA